MSGIPGNTYLKAKTPTPKIKKANSMFKKGYTLFNVYIGGVQGVVRGHLSSSPDT